MSASEQVSRDLQSIAFDLDKRIGHSAGARTAWMLLVFTEGRANYISNAPRQEVVAAIAALTQPRRFRLGRQP